MAIHKERRLSPLRDKPQKKKEEKRDKTPNLSYEGGIDPQQEQLNDVPKKIEEQQNTDRKNRLK